MFKIHIIFDSGFSLRSYPKAYLKILGRTLFSQNTYLLTQSSDFEKCFIFMFPRVENFENPLHFRFELFLRTDPKAYLKMLGWKLLQVYFILMRAFLVELAQGISQNLGGTQFSQKS
ncbi:hypothetical protein E2320_000124 [Naja naja]|nr:hypothetical protein E2320_000124 [Naja naja]